MKIPKFKVRSYTVRKGNVIRMTFNKIPSDIRKAKVNCYAIKELKAITI